MRLAGRQQLRRELTAVARPTLRTAGHWLASLVTPVVGNVYCLLAGWLG
ncbi:MAG: hypothetical protein WKG07_15550 [Hymenobacter sp.]